jgi:hypothetical protein
MPLVALCLRHFLADSIICMCVFDFRQARPRSVVRLSVTEALCFHPFGPEQAFGGVDFASGFPWRAHARIPR